MILGLVVASVLSSGPFIEGIGMVVLGMLLSLIGTDINSGTQRFAFGIPQLFDGIDFVPLAMGIFGFAEIVRNLEPHDEISLVTQKIKNLFPTREDFRRMMPAIFRGTALGTILGVLPAAGPYCLPLLPIRWRRNSRSIRNSSARGDRRRGRS
jgi:TctA family transporter